MWICICARRFSLPFAIRWRPFRRSAGRTPYPGINPAAPARLIGRSPHRSPATTPARRSGNERGQARGRFRAARPAAFIVPEPLSVACHLDPDRLNAAVELKGPTRGVDYSTPRFQAVEGLARTERRGAVRANSALPASWPSTRRVAVPDLPEPAMSVTIAIWWRPAAMGSPLRAAYHSTIGYRTTAVARFCFDRSDKTPGYGRQERLSTAANADSCLGKISREDHRYAALLTPLAHRPQRLHRHDQFPTHPLAASPGVPEQRQGADPVGTAVARKSEGQCRQGSCRNPWYR